MVFVQKSLQHQKLHLLMLSSWRTGVGQYTNIAFNILESKISWGYCPGYIVIKKKNNGINKK